MGGSFNETQSTAVKLRYKRELCDDTRQQSVVCITKQLKLCMFSFVLCVDRGSILPQYVLAERLEKTGGNKGQQPWGLLENRIAFVP